MSDTEVILSTKEILKKYQVPENTYSILEKKNNAVSILKEDGNYIVYEFDNGEQYKIMTSTALVIASNELIRLCVRGKDRRKACRDFTNVIRNKNITMEDAKV